MNKSFSIDENTVRIIILGPRNSGRKWFLQSFPPSLNKYEADPYFFYQVEDIFDNTDLRPIPPATFSENNAPDVIWRFRRKAKKRSYSQVISSHTHVLNITSVEIDDISKTYSSSQNNFVFIVLDPTLLEDYNEFHSFAEGGLENINVQDKKLTKAEYLKYVREILDELAFSSKLKWKIGVCLSKSELISGCEASWSLISSLFGENMVSLFKQYQLRFLEIKLFRISSFGYYFEDGDKRPNPNPIHFDNVWNPEVEAPFFWVFEGIERKRLLENHDFLGRLFFKAQRMKAYMPYSSFQNEFNKKEKL